MSAATGPGLHSHLPSLDNSSRAVVSSTRRKSTKLLFKQDSLLQRVTPPVTPALGGHDQQGYELPLVGESLTIHLDGTGTASTHPSGMASVPGCISTPMEQTELCTGPSCISAPMEHIKLCMKPGCPRGPGGRTKNRGCGNAAARQPGQDAWLLACSLCGLREVNDPRFAYLERGCNKPSLL